MKQGYTGWGKSHASELHKVLQNRLNLTETL